MIKQLTLFVVFIVTGLMAVVVGNAVLELLPQSLLDAAIYNGCTFGCNSRAMSVVWAGSLVGALFAAVSVSSLFMAVFFNRRG